MTAFPPSDQTASVRPLSTIASSARSARVPTGRVLTFLALAIASSSALSAPFAMGLVPTELVGVAVPLAQLSPLLAAVAVTHRGQRVSDALALAVPSRRRLLAGCAVAIGIFCAVPLARLGIGAVTGMAPVDPADGLLGIALAVPVVLTMQSMFAIGEETGWRGWLQTALRPLGFWPAALLIGACWALWHLPIVLALGFSARESIAYLGVILAVGPVLSGLRELGACVWPAVLGHGLLNSVRVAIDQNLAGPLTERTAIGFWSVEGMGWGLWVAAAVVIVGMTRRHGRAAGQNRGRAGD